MSRLISDLTRSTFDVAAGLFYIGFLLLAVYWLATPVRRVLAVCSVVTHIKIRDLRNGKWPVTIPTIRSRRLAISDPSLRRHRNFGLWGAVLVGTSGALFFLGAILGLWV